MTRTQLIQMSAQAAGLFDAGLWREARDLYWLIAEHAVEAGFSEDEAEQMLRLGNDAARNLAWAARGLNVRRGAFITGSEP